MPLDIFFMLDLDSDTGALTGALAEVSNFNPDTGALAEVSTEF